MAMNNRARLRLGLELSRGIELICAVWRQCVLHILVFLKWFRCWETESRQSSNFCTHPHMKGHTRRGLCFECCPDICIWMNEKKNQTNPNRWSVSRLNSLHQRTLFCHRRFNMMNKKSKMFHANSVNDKQHIQSCTFRNRRAHSPASWFPTGWQDCG